MRVFTAFELPESIKDEIYKIINEKSALLRNVKWVEKENLHITCKFLGEISEKQLQELLSKLEKKFKKGEKIRISITNFGCFPNFRNPRVMWLGVQGEVDKLKKVWGSLEEVSKILKIGEREKEYIPHVTIGRLKSSIILDKDWVKYTSKEFEITHLTVFQSTLTPTGPVYKSIVKIPL
uniref:RNA 2',3'-cyclic phosphodiesterase n=1 Tax=candidate division WOR-3 bacterium TaxID=2052148 RepID=A0A7C2K206_UNCW3